MNGSSVDVLHNAKRKDLHGLWSLELVMGSLVMLPRKGYGVQIPLGWVVLLLIVLRTCRWISSAETVFFLYERTTVITCVP